MELENLCFAEKRFHEFANAEKILRQRQYLVPPSVSVYEFPRKILGTRVKIHVLGERISLQPFRDPFGKTFEGSSNARQTHGLQWGRRRWASGPLSNAKSWYHETHGDSREGDGGGRGRESRSLIIRIPGAARWTYGDDRITPSPRP